MWEEGATQQQCEQFTSPELRNRANRNMPQGAIKVKKAHKAVQKARNDKSKVVKKGAPLQLPKNSFRNEALDDRCAVSCFAKQNNCFIL